MPTSDQILRLSYDEMIRAGGSDISVQIPAHLGGGYMASLELDHNIHCLVRNLFSYPFLRSALELTFLVHAVEAYVAHILQSGRTRSR